MQNAVERPTQNNCQKHIKHAQNNTNQPRDQRTFNKMYLFNNLHLDFIPFSRIHFVEFSLKPVVDFSEWVSSFPRTQNVFVFLTQEISELFFSSKLYLRSANIQQNVFVRVEITVNMLSNTFLKPSLCTPKSRAKTTPRQDNKTR